MELSVQKREIKGAKVKTLRRAGIIPGAIFSTKTSRGEGEVTDIQLNQLAFRKLYSVAGESTLIELNIDGDKRDVLVKEVQLDAISLLPIHVGFFEVDMKQPIITEIPIILINEDLCEPVKANQGILITVLDTIEVKSLPKFIPQAFEIDVSVLKNVEDFLTVKDAIKVDSDRIEILSDLDEVIVKVDYAEQQVVEEEAGAVSVEGVEVIAEEEAKGRKEDGDTEKTESKPDSKNSN